jgi:hypothetical protein
VIYFNFINLLARGKVNPEKGLKAVLVKGYQPTQDHSAADISVCEVASLPGSGEWQENVFHVKPLDVLPLGLETREVDGVVWFAGGVPMCHCPVEDEARQGNARYFARTMDFPLGLFEVTG